MSVRDQENHQIFEATGSGTPRKLLIVKVPFISVWLSGREQWTALRIFSGSIHA